MPHPISRRFWSALTIAGFVLFASPFAHASAQTATVGQTVTISVTATGTAPFTYQWCKNGVSIAGAAAPNYSISGVQSTDAGTYNAIVANSVGSTTSDNAVLTVTPASSAPVFTAQPVSQTVTAGAAATFTVAASGVPAPTYQWRKNGANITGATGASYSIASTASSDAGTYSVVASNSAGSATSNNATLTVNPAGNAPVFTLQPESRTVTVNSGVTFKAAASGSPAPTYQWKKDGVSLAGATSSSYAIAHASAASAGTYTVVATNAAGSTTSNAAVLTVNVAPSFITQPVSLKVTAGASATFMAVATGSPAPMYQWRKNGVDIAGATGASYTIAHTVAADAGTYSVSATNCVKSVLSRGVTLTVYAPPVFVAQPASQAVIIGAPVTFTATVSGSPTLTYRWYKNGVRISGAMSASYTLAHVAAGNVGTYTVVATNSLGTATSDDAVLTIRAANSAPPDFNGDGFSDILWQNTVTGERRITLMNGLTPATSVSLPTIGTDWRSIVPSDLNADGQPDVLGQNTVSGEYGAWIMNGVTQAAWISFGTVSTDWQIAAAGDFNDDGHSDILWQNLSTGERRITLMNGTSPIASVSLAIVTPTWLIVGAGDFNGDGQPDTLWQNLATGEYGVWLMNGTTEVTWVSLGTASPGWRIAGTGDFNGDDQADILWQNPATGECSLALMNGTTPIGSVALPTVSTDWEIRN